MHRLLALPYTALATAAGLLALLPLPGEAKALRALRARRGAVERFERWAAATRDRARPLLWMHAPSVGEGLQARPVLELLRQRHPGWQLVYTYFSPSAERFARTLPVDFADVLPFDTPAAARRLLAALAPRALAFSKLDLWPMLAAAASQRDVRLGMFSATLSASSGRRGPLARGLLRDAYRSLDAVGAVDPSDAERLTDLGVRPAVVTVTGDTRYDQVAGRAEGVDRDGPLLAPLRSARTTLVAGSTWPADDDVLLPAWVALRRALAEARLIIAPHEPSPMHFAPIERWARQAGLSLARLGREEPGTDVILVDRLGVLGELYAVADAAFVGGGFHAAGLHSVLEPAAFGVPVLFGPQHHSSRDAGLLIECGGGDAVSGPETLTARLTTWLGDAAARSSASAAARSMVRRGLGAAERSAALVERVMLP